MPLPASSPSTHPSRYICRKHLRANRTAYESDKALTDYYKRLGSRSPVKKEPAVTSGDEAPAKKQRRKTKVADEIAATASSTADTTAQKVSALVKTPSRQSLSRVAASVPLPASPAAVSDLVERQTARLRSSISTAYSKSGVNESVDEARAALSSAYAVQLVFLGLESFGLFSAILPFEPVTTIHPNQYFPKKPFVIKAPDVFRLLTPSFWTPLSLWAATSFILPAVVAYFFNIAHSASATPGRRASPKAHQIIDPVVFSLTKALFVVAVYYYHFNFLGLTTHTDIELVKLNVVGHETGMLASALVGSILSIYEAILKK